MRVIYLLIFVLLIVGCTERKGLAPVVELKWQPQNVHQRDHRVRQGETLYAIAFRYDKDYRQLAAYNHLKSPFALRIGQVVKIPYGIPLHVAGVPVRTAKTITMASRPTHRISSHRNPPVKYPVTGSSHGWVWPANGRVVSNFVPLQGKKGIDIAGKKGDIVKSAGAGVVAYAGSGLAGYGNLIIIKHNGQFLTAYGNNLRNRVVEGQRIKAGQIIADMGIVDRKFWGVHFEIRKAGQPVNPVNYLRR